MGGRRRLTRNKPRLLGHHGGAVGKAYDRAFAALEKDLGPFASELVRFEAGRVAVSMVNLEAATVALAAARRARERGKGRRPSTRELERFQRRQALQDQSYSQALTRLQELAARDGRGEDLAQKLARIQQSGGSR